MFKIKPAMATILFTILHFLVDGICALVIFSSLYDDDKTKGLIIFLVYNIIAFCTQPFVGLLIDKYKNKERLFLIISIISLMLGIIFKFQYIISAILLGIGNSFFHVSGGKYVISKTNNNIVSLGVFVSTGALGLAIGTNIHHLSIWITFISIALIITLILLLSKDISVEENNISNELNLNQNWILILALMIIAVVLIRSFVGKIIPLDFDKPIWVLLLIGASAMLGKALGGVIAKFIGINKTIIITMVLSAILLICFNSNLYLSLFGILLFNCSMPLTLYLINDLLKQKEGFAFGLLAAFLVPGYLFGMFNYPIIATKIMIGILSLLSLLLVIFVNIKMNKEKKAD